MKEFPQLIVETFCPNCDVAGYHDRQYIGNPVPDCSLCHGTGKIERPANKRDIFIAFKILLEDGLTEVNMEEYGRLKVKP